MHPIAILACCSLASLTAATAAPAWETELTSPVPGSHPALAPTTATFQLSWKGLLNAGTLTVDFAPPDANKPGAYVVKSSARSQGPAAKLFPYQHHFWTEIHPSTLRPRYFQGTEVDKKETTVTTVRYFSDHVESSEVSTLLKTGKRITKQHTFHRAPVYDLFSAMLHVRSQKLHAGQIISLVVQPFDTPYLLRVQSHGSEAFEGKQAIRLTVGMRKIDRDTLELKPYKKLKRDATLWLSDDADRLPIELRAAVFIGDVRATLTSRKKL